METAMIRRRAALGSALGAGLAALAAPGFATAPFRGLQTAGWYRLRVGSFECTVISDGAITLAPPFPTFGGGVADAEEVQRMLAANLLPAESIQAQINCVVVNTGRQLVLLDAGMGASQAFGPGGGRLGASLAAAGIEPAQVDIVAFTHAHGDHCWGIADAQGRDVFPNARFLMTGRDLEFWTSESNTSLPAPLGPMVAATRAVVQPRRARFDTLDPNGSVAPGIRAVSTPGHTMGHVSFHVDSDGQRLLVIGDVANHALLALARPDWPFAFDADPGMAAQTRRRVLDLAATDRVQVLGYHFPFPGLGHVVTQGFGFRWLPSPWQWGG
jgi:glyoxylase-like metal-dependent hydrolase (beta-lactamase superfamily II)